MKSKRPPACRRAAAVLALLLPLMAAAAEDIQASFDQAMQAIEADRLRTARESLQALLAGNPSLSRARLELARVHYLSQDYANARLEAQRVLDDPNTPPAVRATVLAFLAQIDADEKRLAQRHRLDPALYAGMLYDSNVNFGPARDIIDIGGVPFTVTPASQPVGDFAGVINPSIGHTFNPGMRFESGEHTGFFLWQSQASAYYRGYISEDDYNLGILTLRTGPAWVVPNHWRGAVGLQADQIWLGHGSLALFSTLNPTITWNLESDLELTLDAVVSNRHYWRTGEEARDGWGKGGGISVTRYRLERRLALQAGVGYLRFDADEAQFSNSSPEIYANAAYQAWAGGTVFLRSGYHYYGFDGTEPGFGVRRHDDEWRLALGFEHVFASGPLQGWALQGSWAYTQNDSNVSTYDYDRHLVNLGLAGHF